MAARPQVSPSRSPTGRLPSPPPIAEDQSAPQSPHLGGSVAQVSHGAARSNEAALRRVRPGAKATEMADGPPLVELGDIDSPFQLTEHLKSLHFSHTNPESSHLTRPLSKEHAILLSQPPSGIDRSLWLYELCRFLVQKVNVVIVALFADSPACSAQTCPEMRASEWQYLCAVHDPPKACCAIDYCCHTLDWAANTLTSPKHFPSRLSLGTENTAPQHQVRQLTNIFRRVYRIFAHAWFSHREMFWRTEGKTGLYVFFKTVCDNYNLIPEDNYTIPPEAEGNEPTETSTSTQQTLQPVASILKRNNDLDPQRTDGSDETNAASGLMPSATARRHRQTPSKGAPVGTVMEENEEDEEPKLEVDPSFQSGQFPALQTEPPPTNGTDDDVPFESLTKTTTQFHAEPLSPVAAPPPATESAGIIASSDETLATAPPVVPGLSSPIKTDSQPVEKSGSKTFASFSPASPKASTFEELEQQNAEEEEKAGSQAAEVQVTTEEVTPSQA